MCPIRCATSRSILEAQRPRPQSKLLLVSSTPVNRSQGVPAIPAPLVAHTHRHQSDFLSFTLRTPTPPSSGLDTRDPGSVRMGCAERPVEGEPCPDTRSLEDFRVFRASSGLVDINRRIEAAVDVLIRHTTAWAAAARIWTASCISALCNISVEASSAYAGRSLCRSACPTFSAYPFCAGFLAPPSLLLLPYASVFFLWPPRRPFRTTVRSQYGRQTDVMSRTRSCRNIWV